MQTSESTREFNSFNFLQMENECNGIGAITVEIDLEITTEIVGSNPLYLNYGCVNMYSSHFCTIYIYLSFAAHRNGGLGTLLSP